ncbi:immunity protein Imm33 domain-containing protein [Chelatococcus asaccharovorans]|uniref:DUF2185 domain-containing protein n=1 Tax=Chelatococcus asaccharovorans TaxID=28210 RepID=A0A2V3UE89_9HYPH|nr:DUF2185 domain-containing protein [Chelatococcus asaccharovorans]MBS7702685.1 DUF2185 domain-containing protein [Chelatococcus asaccharovorans]PXW56980.1 hypothetical protein C7450_10717 [Chelatococcus asaccharovorans]
METPDTPGYALMDPRERAAEAPYTFFLPSSVELAAISPGDLVKLIFEHAPPSENIERMWVTVEEVQGEALQGKLANEPYEEASSVHLGDSVAFERYQVVDIIWRDPAGKPQPEERREFWDRCLVDACVLDGSEPVEYLCREEPNMGREGDSFPDSGWRIRGRFGDASDEEVQARKAQYVALGAVLNADDSWLHLIDAPIGSRLMRDFESGDYVEVEE